MTETETTADRGWSGQGTTDDSTGRVSRSSCLLSMSSVQFGAALQAGDGSVGRLARPGALSWAAAFYCSSSAHPSSYTGASFRRSARWP